jgi:PAS domain S-box-containing protein
MLSQQSGGSNGFEVLVRELPDAVLVVDRLGRVLLSNREQEFQVGRQAPSLGLSPDLKAFHLDGRRYEDAEWPLARALGAGEVVADEEFYVVGVDGARRSFTCRCAPFYDDQGRLGGAVLVARDVSDEQRSRDQLAYLLAMLDHTEEAIIACDAQWRINAWNRGAERMYGWTAAEVLGQPASFFRLDGNDEQRLERRVQLAEHGRWRGEICAEGKDGSQLSIEAAVVAIRDGDGGITGYLGVHRDIDERKHAEEALREANRRTETILESIGDIFFAVDREWRYTYVNQRAVEHARLALGRTVTAEELLGNSCWELFPDSLDTPFDHELHRALREQRIVHFEALSGPTGRWLEVRAYPSDDGLSVYTRDITDRKRAEEQLREANSRAGTILESISDSFFGVDREWRYSYLNDRALDRIRMARNEELSREDVLGQNCWEFISGTADTVFYTELHRALRQQTTVEFEAYSGATGMWTEVHAYPSAEGLSVYARDVSDRREAQEELERRTRQQAAVAELGVKALEDGALLRLMDEAVRLVCRTLGVEFAKVDELLPEGEGFMVSAGAGWREGVVGSCVLPAGRGSPAGYALLVGAPVIVDDMSAETRFEVPAVLREHEVMSYIAVVIDPPGDPFGTLAAASRERRSFSEEDVSFVQAVANVLASAVERARSDERLEAAREAERSRIARDLHDEALSGLADAIALAHRVQAPASETETVEHVDQLMPTLKHVGQQIRAAIYDLRLDADEHKPFRERLESLVALHRSMGEGLEIELDVRGDDVRFPGRTGTQLLRVVGEALTNARRHAGAKTINVVLGRSGEKLTLEVSDDGGGLDEIALGGDERGIRGMRERAAMVGAELTIESGPGVGTLVRVQLPLSPPGIREKSVRVLLVEDHVSVRQALATAFGQEQDFEVAGQAGSLAEARQMLEDVDVAIVDLALPDGYGGEIITELRERNPEAQALVLTASPDRAAVARAVETGAAAVINKTVPLQEVLDTVRRLQAGEMLMPPEELVALPRVAGNQRRREPGDRQALANLTAREREVLQALANGLDSRQIADRLHISIRTEQNHVASILAKLGVHSRLQALVFALRYGIVEIS